MMLADRLGDYDAVDALLDKADEIIAEAREYDTGFVKTPAARLISGTTDYIPQLPVDNTAYYMQLKKQFQGWQKVELAEREAEVRRLLEELDKVKESLASKEFNDIIGPEEKQMRTALEKGFDEMTTTTTYSDTDPNYL
jgi:vacuolar-type H+-ATPase subunit H